MSDPRTIHPGDIYLRRRASDRARERASRAAYFGDRAGLLIATGAAEALMSTRLVADREIESEVKAEPVRPGLSPGT